MARISLAGHWKFRRLVRAIAALMPASILTLTRAEPIARGILEQLWEAGYNAVSEYVGSPADIADAVGWTADPDVLVQLLLDAGFLERDLAGDVRIHDLWPNAPRFAQFRWQAKNPGKPLPWKPADSSSEVSSEVNSEASSERSSERSSEVNSTLKGAVPREYQGSPGKRKSSAADASRSPNNGNEKPDPRQLVALGYELVRQGYRFGRDADLKDTLKDLAARHGIPYDAGTVAEALDVLRHAKAPLWADAMTGKLTP